MMGNKKLQVWLPLLFAIVMVVGMFIGYKMGSQGGKKNGFFASNSRGSVQEALDYIRLKYVDTVNVDSLQGRAIQEMMLALDPHSIYLPPVQLKEANEELAGDFEGIGVEFNIFSDTVNVVYVIPNGPSDKAGLQVGDEIIKVNGHSLIGKADPDSIKKYIRGEGGSKAVLDIIRGSTAKIVTVTRGTIPVSAVDAAYMIDKTTGYIKLNKFTDHCYREFMEALEGLQKQDLKGLVLDLRGNGGGFMNEAVEIADEFLDGDKLIVYTEGANSKKREYRCKRPGLFEKGKLVLLVDELTASASEVLAGAMQDWCRATIVGRRTFGKGLVQEQYSLSDGSAIRLTVARYYTPLGRSIQRSYQKGKKVYMDELLGRYNTGEMLSVDSLRLHNTGEKYMSTCNDTLYGSDGISPNVFVPLDTSRALQKIYEVQASTRISSFIYQYYLQRRSIIDKYPTVNDYIKDFNNEDIFHNLLIFAGDSSNLRKLAGREKELLEMRLKALLAKYRWRNSGLYQVLNNEDPTYKKALEIIAR